jgi:hypothetical protein
MIATARGGLGGKPAPRKGERAPFGPPFFVSAYQGAPLLITAILLIDGVGSRFSVERA